MYINIIPTFQNEAIHFQPIPKPSHHTLQPTNGPTSTASYNRILKGGVVIPLIFPNLPQCSPTESSGFPRNARNALGHPGTRKRTFTLEVGATRGGIKPLTWPHHPIRVAKTHTARPEEKKEKRVGKPKNSWEFFGCFFLFATLFGKNKMPNWIIFPNFFGGENFKNKETYLEPPASGGVFGR